MNRIIVILVCVALALAMSLPTLAATQGPLLGAWSDVVATGTYTARMRAACAVANGRLWLIGGKDAANTTILDKVEGYNPTTNAWETADPMPAGRVRSDAAAVAVDGKIYVIGGFTSPAGARSTAVDVFDPTAASGSQWTVKADLPTSLGGPVAVYVTKADGTKQIHVYTGDGGATYPADHAYMIYNVAGNTWTALSATFTAPSAQKEACGVAAKDLTTGVNYIYIFGGFASSQAVSKEVWRLDPASGSAGTAWDAHVHVMTDRRNKAAAVTIDAKDSDGNPVQYPIVFGGNSNKDRTNPQSYAKDVMVYVSGSANGWVKDTTTVAPYLPENRGERPAVGIIDGYVYVAGGANAWDGTNSKPVLATKVYKALINSSNYPPAPATETKIIGAWENAGANIPTGRGDSVFGVVDSKIYVISGWTSSSTLTSANEMYDPATNTWTTKAPIPIAVKGAAATVIGGKIYVAGGQSAANQFEGALQIYDPVADTWSSGAAMTTPRNNVCGYTETNGDQKFHVLGGSKQGNANPGTHEVYDPATNTWATFRIGTPYSFYDAACTEVIDGTWDWIFFGTGYAWSNINHHIQRYNGKLGSGANITWGDCDFVPYGGVSGATMATLTDTTGKRRAAIFGGIDSSKPMYDRVFVYHDFGELAPFTNKWVEDTWMPAKRGDRPAVVQIGNFVYVAAGTTADKNGNISPIRTTWRGTIGATGPAQVTTIGAALSQPNRQQVNFQNYKVVTRFYFSNTTGDVYLWVEETNRSAALKLGPTTAYALPGTRVLISGTMSTDPNTGERILSQPTVNVDDTGTYDIPAALAMTNKSFLGGTKGAQPGRPGGIGINNMGMLVKVCGRVTLPVQTYAGYEGMSYFYMDDGSGLLDGTTTAGVPNIGLRVYTDPMSLSPAVNKYALMRGIVSSEMVNGVLVPILLADNVLYFETPDCRVL